MTLKTFLNNYFFLILMLIISLYIYLLPGIHFDFKVIFTNLLIVLLSLLFMFFGDKYNYSLNKMFMLFSFFFFGIAPALQYKYGVVFWGGNFFNSDEYFMMNIIILLILCTYQGAYYYFGKIKLKELGNHDRRFVSPLILLLISSISLLITLYFNSYNLENLLLRSGGDGERIELSSSLKLIYSNFIRPLPVVALVIFKMFGCKNKKIELLLISIVILSNFPTSRARFYIAAMYIPLLIIYFKQFNTKYMLLNKVVILGLLIVFPFLDQMRRIKNLSDIKFSLDFQMFLQGHFDSYQMFLRAINNDFVTMGEQLLGALFFFVPRSIWNDKPLGSGYQLAHNSGLTYDNVSMNYFGEGFINFGYFGILIFLLFIAFINARLDKLFWLKLNTQKINIKFLFYLFLLGLEIFILRGDLLSSFGFTIGILFSVIFVYVLSTKKSKEKIISYS